MNHNEVQVSRTDPPSDPDGPGDRSILVVLPSQENTHLVLASLGAYMQEIYETFTCIPSVSEKF